MSAPALQIDAIGLVSSVGSSRAANCAAMRAKVANPSELRYHDYGNEPVLGHRVPVSVRIRGTARLVEMCADALYQCVEAHPRLRWKEIPLLLCVAEPERAGRPSELESTIAKGLAERLPPLHARLSSVFAGRTGVAMALSRARELIADGHVAHALVASTDSLLHHATLYGFEARRRLLTSLNSDGFMPGEGAGALLVSAHEGGAGLKIVGVGQSTEVAHVDSGEPLRADGLCAAIRHAVSDAGESAADFDFSVSDVAGEQYAFKEASLALSRTLRVPKSSFEFWQPAETVGHCGVSLPLMCLALAGDAMEKGYAPGRRVLLHFGDDRGGRAAVLAEAG